LSYLLVLMLIEAYTPHVVIAVFISSI
jgi:hypothetical protein